MSQVSNPLNPHSDHKTRLILGCGYVGQRIANLWMAANDRVLALSRTQERAAELEKLGIEPIVWNWLDSKPLPDSLLDTLKSSQIETILVAVSHSSSSHAQGLAHLADSIAGISNSRVARAEPRWIYLSTTGVFAERNEDHGSLNTDPSANDYWVDEDSPVGPSRPGSINALEAEQWLDRSGLEHVILRPAGIYGPGRIPNIQPIRDGQAIQADPQSYLNLIHVDDLAEVIARVAQGTLQHRLYCVSDGNSVRRNDYYSFIAESMNYPLPTYNDPSSHQGPRRRNQGNKRVSNQRLISDYSIHFRFPDYRSGLMSLLQEFPR